MFGHTREYPVSHLSTKPAPATQPVAIAPVEPCVRPAVGTVGEDGFTYYTCKGECGETKIAALFLPNEIATGELRCRACLGEIDRRPVSGPRPSAPANQRPGWGFVNPHYTRSVPMRFRTGGIPR